MANTLELEDGEIGEEEFRLLARRVGVDLSVHPISELCAAYGHVRAMAARVRAPLSHRAASVQDYADELTLPLGR